MILVDSDSTDYWAEEEETFSPSQLLEVVS